MVYENVDQRNQTWYMYMLSCAPDKKLQHKHVSFRSFAHSFVLPFFYSKVKEADAHNYMIHSLNKSIALGIEIPRSTSLK